MLVTAFVVHQTNVVEVDVWERTRHVVTVDEDPNGLGRRDVDHGVQPFRRKADVTSVGRPKQRLAVVTYKTSVNLWEHGIVQQKRYMKSIHSSR